MTTHDTEIIGLDLSRRFLSRSDEGRICWHTSNIAKLSGSLLPKRDSQIEAVCADDLGRIALLQETPSRVELIDPNACRVVASIDRPCRRKA